ncbi:MAG: PCRF domain-containing protein, partial [Dehalococcoidia bacterium]
MEAQSGRPNFWDDPQRAQQVMRHLAEARETVARWRGFERRAQDLAELLALATAEEDEAVLTDVAAAAADLKGELDSLELSLALAGPYDRRHAIVAIHAGAGGTDSMDWAEMLLRMYLRWAERHGYISRVL